MLNQEFEYRGRRPFLIYACGMCVNSSPVSTKYFSKSGIRSAHNIQNIIKKLTLHNAPVEIKLWKVKHSLLANVCFL